MKLEIKKTGINGEGIGYYNRKPVFIDGCFPGEVADVTIAEDHRTYYRGSLNRIISAIKDREESPCNHYSKCGSCPFITLEYGKQLEYKKEIMQETLNKYSGLDLSVGDFVPSRQFNYRNKLSMAVKQDRSGYLYNVMYKANSNIPVKIKKCYLHTEELENVRKKVLMVLNTYRLKEYDNRTHKGIRGLVIRGFEEFQVTVITGEDVLTDDIIRGIMNIKSVVSLYQGKNIQKNAVSLMPDEIQLLSGKDSIDVKISDYKVSLHPKAFFQLNKEQAEAIYSKVRNLVREHVNVAVEAFCGIGIMSMMLHDICDEVIGIEIDRNAVASARENVKANRIRNVSFVCNDATREIISLVKKKKIDLLVVDPPRTGLDDDFIKCINKSGIRKIIYVSCNPATLARNIRDLSARYRVTEIIPYDMFPNTPHCESITVLERR
ncbi:MAG: 23S rRNA (uracil(1939)-C(5))-methyltransferase RlmD [Erysipelotrichaceae bacterium]|nr:23S rRNA (uracil(1939)-C(5))-methyltransferase RlmD [Erysipelotrichaceae bacterium]